MSFKKREDAEESMVAINKDDKPDWFCPLIKDVCRKDCVCFRPAYVWNLGNPYVLSGGPFMVVNSECGNRMFSGGVMTRVTMCFYHALRV